MISCPSVWFLEILYGLRLSIKADAKYWIYVGEPIFSLLCNFKSQTSGEVLLLFACFATFLALLR